MEIEVIKNGVFFAFSSNVRILTVKSIGFDNFVNENENTTAMNGKGMPYLLILSLITLLMSISTNSNANATNHAYQYATIEQHRACQKKVAVDGGKMAYIDMGEGAPILLVHGVPTSSWLYRFVIDDLLQQGYRVIAPDLLGYGNSDKPKGVDNYDLDKQGKRLVQLMDALEIDTWTHVLHDAGGVWSWEMMQQAPERATKVVILNTIAYKEGFKPPMTFKRGTFKAKFYTKLYKRLCKMMMKMTLKNGTCRKKLSKAECKGYWLPMKEGGNRALYNFFTSFDEIDKRLPAYHKMFAKTEVPCIIIWGELDDILVGEKQAPLLSKSLNIPDEDVHLLKEAKHFIQEEQYEEIGRLIGEFVER